MPHKLRKPCQMQCFLPSARQPSGRGVGARRPDLGLAAAAVLACLLLAVGAQAADKRLVVIYSQGRQAAELPGSLRKTLERRLAQQVTLIPATAYRRAARLAGVRRSSLDAPEAAVRAGAAVGATHVLFIQPLGAPLPRRRARPTGPYGGAQLMLIDAVTGETLLSKRYKAIGRGAAAASGQAMLVDLQPLLGRQPRRYAPRLTAAPPLEPVPSPPYAQAGEPAVAPPAAPPATYGGPWGPTAAEAPDPTSVAPSVAAAAADSPPLAPAAAPSDPPKGAWRPALRLLLGTNFFVRTARLQVAQGSSGVPPCYCEASDARPPVFGRLHLQAELYPFAFGGSGKFYEGFGLHGEGQIGLARTNVGDGVVQSSLLGGIAGGVQYRWVIFSSVWSPDVQLRAGLSSFSFPLENNRFVGVGYHAYYGGLQLSAPIAPHVAVVLGGNYLPWVIGFGGTDALGSQIQYGEAYHLEGGPRLSLLDILEIRATFNYDAYSVPFSGRTALRGSRSQYRNVVLDDVLWGVMLGLAVAL